MLTVACVLRVSNDYDAEYVQQLSDAVFAYLPSPHRFVCLSDVPVPCERIPFEYDWPTWWSKIELFKLPPPVLYFDLDTMIVGDLTDIAATASLLPFVALQDFYREKGLGSGMMSWASDMSRLYRTFAERPGFWQDRCHRLGDQGFIEQTFTVAGKWQTILPGQVVSYKKHAKDGVPDDARVICFHGKPKPRDIAWTI